MLNQVISLEKNGKVFNTTVKILDINTNCTKHGCNYQYLIKLQNGKHWGTFTFDDSIYHWSKNIQKLNLMDIFHCLILDYSCVEDWGTNIADIEKGLFDVYGYEDFKEIRRVAKELLKNYELLNRVFTQPQLQELYAITADY